MISEEKFVFKPQHRKVLLLALVVGVVLTLVGLFIAMGGDHHGGSEGHHGSPLSVKKLFANLWVNNVFFAGLSIIGIFFFAVQYAAQVGWSCTIKRIPLSFGSWLPIAFFSMIIVYFIGGHDIFHWTHSSLYEEVGGDKIIQGKASYFFYPLEPGTFPLFFVARMIIFFAVWFLLFKRLKSMAKDEDKVGGIAVWNKLRKMSAIFLIFFAVSSSMAAWDWVMSIDAHWFSTMFGWYNFASWWVAGLALTLLIVIILKENGYLSVVNDEHIHDLGKFIFAFSIFWTYIWFSQFLLIYYAHIPEETVYFLERWKGSYSFIFYANIIINFIFPFLLLMPRNAKRNKFLLKVVCGVLIFGHWLDFYQMVTPAILIENGSMIGFLEIGLLLVYLSAFLLVTLTALSKYPLFSKNHPMLNESLHHHV